MNSVTRRYFLMSSGLGVAAPLAARASSLNGANNRIRVAVIGVKGRGGSHISGFAALSKQNVELAALCDVDESVLNRRLAEAEKQSIKKLGAFTDMRRVFDDKSIDVVSFATPNHWHALGTTWACQAGKDVYVEKPASHNIFEGRKMVEAARKYHRIVQHGTQIRSSPAIQEAMQLLREGAIGDVYMAKGLCYKRRDTIGKASEEAVPSGVHYDLWMGPAPARPFTRNRFHYQWHWQWAYGNGDIGNQGVHQLDVARWGLGVGLPSKVQSMGGHFMFDDDQETPNTQLTAFMYPAEKKLLTFEVRHWDTPAEGTDLKIGVLFLGSKGYMEISSYGQYRIFLGKEAKPSGTRDEDGDHFANFIQAVRSRKPEMLNADIEEGHRSSALAHLANLSYRLGRTLVFDPQSETFPGDAEANAHLGRKYRSPYVVPEKV
ncbi:MAG: Gfo/Idh/MocA family oxidoreductase [Acidimicrobiia bacterium]|nr:Gfo/Idh/MocA family oxidoreductase [Acidimicrobiia bacterium]